LNYPVIRRDKRSEIADLGYADFSAQQSARIVVNFEDFFKWGKGQNLIYSIEFKKEIFIFQA